MEIDMSSKNGLDPFMSLKKGLVFLGNLHTRFLEDRLFYALNTFGKCSWLHALCNDQGVSLGYAYAKYEDEKGATTFLENSSKMEVVNGGQPLFAMASDINVCTRFADAGKLALLGFGDEITKDTLLQICGQYGSILRIEMSPSFAVIHFANEWCARSCVVALRGTELGGRPISICLFDKYPSVVPSSSKRCVVLPYNLEPDVDNNKLSEMFSFLGQYVNARVERNADNSSRCRGYVFFDRPATDSPLLMSYNMFENRDGDLVLMRQGFSIHTAPKEQKFDQSIRFHPSAAPVGSQGLYAVPKEYADLVDGLETFDMSEDADPCAFIVGAFTVHVSNLEHLSEESVNMLFAQYGKMVYCTVQTEKNLDRFALVTYRKYSEAQNAVEQIRLRRFKKREPRLRAEIMDSYYWYHYQQGLADMEAQQIELANQMHKMQQMSHQQPSKFGSVGSERKSNTIQNREEQGTADNATVVNAEQQVVQQSDQQSMPQNGQQVVQQNGQQAMQQNSQQVMQQNSQPSMQQSSQQVMQQNGQQPMQQSGQQAMQQNGQQTMQQQQQPIYTSYMYQMQPNGQQLFYQQAGPGPTYYTPVYVQQNQMYQMPGAPTNQMYPPQQPQVRLPTVQEKHSAKIMDRIARLFPKYNEKQRNETLQMCLQIPMLELNGMLSFDNQFRAGVVRRAVALARGKK